MDVRHFVAGGGTRFLYREDLSGDLKIQVTDFTGATRPLVTVGQYTATMTVPVEDLMQFAAHLAESPSSVVESYDGETATLILEHVSGCEECKRELARCAAYRRLVVERSVGKGAIQ
jgi:hypothetical protein